MGSWAQPHLKLASDPPFRAQGYGNSLNQGDPWKSCQDGMVLRDFLGMNLEIRSGEKDDDEVGGLDVAREGTMNEHENDTRMPGDGEGLPVLGRGKRVEKRRKADLVVDLSEIKELNLTSLALLLTAQQVARKEDRDVWLTGVPMQFWQALNAMGLGHFFKPFPVSEAVAV